MTTAFVVSYALLWVLLALVVLAVLVLARQVGLLNARLPGFGAATADLGPPIGDEIPIFKLMDVDGRPLIVGGPLAKRQLIVFVSPHCPACASLLPALGPLQRTERRNLDIIMVGLGTSNEAASELTGQHGLKALRVVIDSTLADSWDITSTPYAVLVDRTGIVRAKGVANTIEHVESLLYAEEVGIPTLEEHVASTGDPRERAEEMSMKRQGSR